MRSSPLLAGLRTLVPDETRTLLLRAALLEGASRTEAWDRLGSSGVDLAAVFRSDTVGVKRLGPLLYVSGRHEGAACPPEWEAVLRTAYAREEMRAGEYAKILGNLIRALNDESIDHLLLTGAALGHTVYPSATLRHAHDIDVWIQPGSEAKVIRALEPAGFSSPRPTPLSGCTLTGLVHDSLLPVLLHERFFRVQGLGPQLETARAEASGVEILGAPTRVLAPHHALLRVFGRAALCAHRAGTQWVADACHILQKRALDWPTFVGAARSGQLAAPALVFLDYLAREMDIDVSDDTFAGLQAGADDTSPFIRDVLLFGTRHHAPGGSAFHPPDITSAAARQLRRTLLFPSGDYLRWSFGSEQGIVAVLWLRRLLRSLR